MDPRGPVLHSGSLRLPENVIMSPLSLLLLAAILALAGISFLFMGAAFPRVAPAAPARPVTRKAAAQCERSAAPLPVEWTGSAARPPDEFDAGRQAIRDRYVSLRFAGVFTHFEQFGDVRKVITAARLYYEDGKRERAQEALAIALQLAPGDMELRLAQIELAFLARDGELFTELAQVYRSCVAGLEDWNEICHLGRALSPEQPIFNDGAPLRDPGGSSWPDTPNWIQATWDLTPDVLAADFHRAITLRSAS